MDDDVGVDVARRRQLVDEPGDETLTGKHAPDEKRALLGVDHVGNCGAVAIARIPGVTTSSPATRNENRPQQDDRIPARSRT